VEYDSELNDSARVKSFIDTWHKIFVGSRKKRKGSRVGNFRFYDYTCI